MFQLLGLYGMEINDLFSLPLYTNPAITGDSLQYDWMNASGLTANATYTPATANGYNSSYNMNYIVVGPVRVIEPAESWGKYRRWETAIRLIPDYLQAAPKPRDKINWGYQFTTDGPVIEFQICKIQGDNYLGRPYCVTADYMDFQLLLSDTVNILQANCSGASLTGNKPITFTTLASGIPAAIEPRSQEIKDTWGSLINPETYDCYLDNDVSAANSPSIVKAGAIIQNQNGVQYDIKEITDRERLDLKTHLVIEKKL